GNVELVDPLEPLLLGRHGDATLAADRSHQLHVGAAVVQLKIVRHVLARNRGRKWPKALAIFDPQIELALQARRAGVAEDGAVAERARTELHPALKPPDDLLLRQRGRDLVEQRLVVDL